MTEPNVDLSDEALEKAFPGEPEYDVLVTINADWLAVPKGSGDVIAYMVSGASKADIETFEMNRNRALEWAEAHEDAWEVIVPDHAPPTIIELGDDAEDDEGN